MDIQPLTLSFLNQQPQHIFTLHNIGMHMTNVDLSFLIEDESLDEKKILGAPVRQPPVTKNSQATVKALDKVYGNFIPLLGFEQPKQVPGNESIWALWSYSEARIIDQKADIPNLLKPVYDVLICDARPTPEKNVVTTPGHTFEVAVRLNPEAPKFVSQGLKRHDSTRPSSRHASLNLSTTFPAHNDDKPSSYPLYMSTTSQNHNRAERRRALGRALVSVHNRRPQAFREGVHEMVKRGDSVTKMYRILSLAEDGGLNDV